MCSTPRTTGPGRSRIRRQHATWFVRFDVFACKNGKNIPQIPDLKKVPVFLKAGKNMRPHCALVMLMAAQAGSSPSHIDGEGGNAYPSRGGDAGGVPCTCVLSQMLNLTNSRQCVGVCVWGEGGFDLPALCSTARAMRRGASSAGIPAS